MKNTFRKSTLISSVALLLVAIVALGGATFAWFSSNDTTSAEGIQLTAAAASGLYIVESNSDTLPGTSAKWGSTVDFGITKDKMAPASSSFSSLTNPSFVTTVTDQADGSYNGATINNAVAGTDYIVKHIWVKGDGDTATTLNATINLGVKEGTSVQGYERCAVIDVTDASKPAYVGGNVFAAAEETASYYPLTTGGAASTAVTPATAGSQIPVSTSWVPNTGRHFVIYCWFEGQDADCKNVKSGANLVFDMSFALPSTQG